MRPAPMWRRYLTFWRPDPDADLDEEFRFHLETEIEELVAAGMTPERARAAALDRFGDVEAARAVCRSADVRRASRERRAELLDTLRQDVRHALRSFRRQPRFVAAAVLTLALGVGANTAVFSVVNGVLLSPLAYRDPDRLVLLWQSMKDMPQITVSYQDYLDWRASARSFEDVAVYNGFDSYTLTDACAPSAGASSGASSGASAGASAACEAERVHGGLASGNLFQVLGVGAARGRAILPRDDSPAAEPVAVISDALWRSRFGEDARVVGRRVTLDGRAYTVVGVLAPEIQLGGVDVWLPIGRFTDTPRFVRTNHPGLLGIGRLRPGVTLPQMQADLARVSAAIHREHPETVGVDAGGTFLKEIVVGSVRPALRMLAVAVGLVLLIACANVANLMIGRAAERQHDFALRAAIGAGRGRLVRQSLTESGVLALLGGALGVALAWAGVRLLLALEPAQLPRLQSIRVDTTVLAFALGVSLLTGVLFGIAPARQLARSAPLGALREGGRGQGGGRSRRRLASVLTVAEVALALVLLVGAGLLLRSFAKLTGVEPGFDPRGVVASQVRLPESAYPDDASRRRLFDELLRRVRVLPGVADAAVGSDLPLSSGWQSTMTFEGLPFERGAAPMFNGAVVSDGYFRTVRMRLLAGRALAPTDGERAPPVAVVSARVARQMFGARDPIGRRLRQGFGDSQEPWRTIVGVVDDVRNDGLAVASRGTIYYPAGQMGSASMWLVVRAGGAMAGTPERLVPALRRELAALDRAVPLAETQTLEEALARSVSQPRFSMLMLAVFASSALLLAAVGLYGVVATSAAQRRREIGVRIALGARRGAVVRSVVWQSVRLVAAGAVIGGAAAWGGGRVLASLLYEVRPTDPPVFAGVVLLLVGVAVAAALVPAARAARIDPAAVMRDG